VKDIAWKAQTRLSARYRRLVGRGKAPQKVATAIARELLGFMWAIGCAVERRQGEGARAAAAAA
jgi:transposase